MPPRTTILASSVLLAACTPTPAPPPPPNRAFEGLPITGTRAFAERMGFTRCVDTASALRCRRDGVTLFGSGPYSAAVDLHRNGRSGFQLLTVWHDRDQYAVYAISDALRDRGWSLCRTGTADRGDQMIWSRPGTAAGQGVRVMMDLSYWSKRRIRIVPELGQPLGPCL